MSESQRAFKVAKAPGAIEAAQQFMDLSQEYLELVPRLPAQALPFGRSLRSRTTKPRSTDGRCSRGLDF